MNATRECLGLAKALGLLVRNLPDVLFWRPKDDERDVVHAVETVWLAHRGLHEADPAVAENTLEAVQRALAQGYGVEVDVRLSLDKVVVLMHDATLARVTEPSNPARVDSLTANELAEIKLGGTECTVPRLDSVLDAVVPRIGTRRPIIIEVKNFGLCVGEIEQAVADVVMARARRADSDWIRFVAISSFNPLVLAWFREHYPDIGRILIGSTSRSLERGWLRVLRPLLERFFLVRWAQPDLIAWELGDLPEATARRLRGLRKDGMSIMAFTVKSDLDASRARRFAKSFIYEGPIHPDPAS